MKALHLARNQEAWGHVVARLLGDLPDDIEVPRRLLDQAEVREEALRHAGAILAFARLQMA